MQINYITVITTIINFAILIAIMIGLYTAVQVIKNFIIKNKESDKKY